MTGAEGGRELVKKLVPLAWISAHDGDKKLQGLTTKKLKVEKYSADGVEKLLSPLSPTFPKLVYVEAMVLDSGADVVYSQKSHREVEEGSRKALTLVGSQSSQFNDDNTFDPEDSHSWLSWASCITACFPKTSRAVGEKH